MSSTPERRLPIGKTYNLRDVGGYPVTGGATTSWGRLFRSDYPDMGDAGRPELARLRLRTVIDLRAPGERAARPSELDGLVGRTISYPFSVAALLAEDPRLGESLGALYTAAVHRLGAQIAAVVSLLGEPDALPALVHCAAGKDRTGIIIGLILSAIGVADDTVAADYALTADYLTPQFFAAADTAAAIPIDHIDITPLHGARPEVMLDMLGTITTLSGSAASYLTDHGVPPTNLERLRTALIDTR